MNKIFEYIEETSPSEMGFHFLVGLFGLVVINMFFSLSLSLGRYIETGENLTVETKAIHYIIGIPSLTIGIIACIFIGSWVTRMMFPKNKKESS